MHAPAGLLIRGSWDDPEAYIAGDRRRALAAGTTLPDRVRGAALFADLSGFTPLTEAMHAEYGRTRGAEQLTVMLGTVFDAVLGELHRFGGSVVYFSGDAVTCWLDGDDGHLAAACGLAMHDAMRAVGQVPLPSGRTFTIALKVTVAVGAARRFVVGDPDIQLIDVLAGSLIDDLAAAEAVAQPGEVVLEASATRALGNDAVIRERRDRAGREYAVLAAIAVPVEQPSIAPQATRLPDELVRPWLLPPVWERLRTGHGEFLAELRPAIPVFIRFTGIDFDDDPDAESRLDDFIVRAQRVVDGYGGAVLQLTLGDKGAYLYAVFGSPIAHEDDASRACAAALDVLALEHETAVVDLQIGIAQGRLRSGTYGHPFRRTFCCLGDAVNLAARLMTKAQPGSAVVAEAVQRAAGDRFVWERLPDLTVKGKRDPVVAFELQGTAAVATPRRHHESPMVGRDREMQQMVAALDAAATGHGRIVGIRAEAGMGKSRLLAEAVGAAQERGMAVVQGEAQPFGTRASYFAWRSIWRALLGVPEAEPLEVLRHLIEHVGAQEPELRDRVPLLGAVLGVDLPDTQLTLSFDAKLRKTSLESLLSELLALRVGSVGPTVIVLEDCHWLDPLSKDLLGVLAHAVPELPVALLVAYRPEDGPDDEWRRQLLTMPQTSELELGELDAPATKQLVAQQVEYLFGFAPPPQPLVGLVTERAGGNAFHVQELVSYVASQDVDPADATALASLDVPETLHALVLSRIDMLVERVRRTLKVASVIGRLFDLRTLKGAYPDLGSPTEMVEDVSVMQSQDLVLPDDAEGLHYLFRHVVVRDVAYDSLPFAMRETLHESVASFMEEDPALAGSGRRRLDLLAHHYSHTRNDVKKRSYLVLAGDAAADDYANAVAADYFRRAAELGTPVDQAEVLVKLGGAQELSGEWGAAETSYRRAVDLTADRRNEVVVGALNGLAEVARKHARYDEAERFLDSARDIATSLRDDVALARSLHIGGTLASQRGDVAAARERYSASLRIRRRLGDRLGEAAMLSNLAIVAEQDDDYGTARQLHEQVLDLCRAAGDRWKLAVCHINLGNLSGLQGVLSDASRHYSEAARLCREVGDPWLLTQAQHGLANTDRDLTRLPEAGAVYLESLDGLRRFDDPVSVAALYEDIARFAVRAGQPETALRLAGVANRIRRHTGAPRFDVDQADLDSALAPARAMVADPDGAEAEGQALSDGDAAALVRRLVAVVTP